MENVQKILFRMTNSLIVSHVRTVALVGSLKHY